jgi:hypothetical protein
MNKKIIFLLTTVLAFSVLLAGCEQTPTFNRTVKFYATADSGEPVYTLTVESGKTLGSSFPEAPSNKPKPTDEFLGWFEGDTQYTESSVINTDVELRAKWVDTRSLVKVSFIVTDGGVAVDPVYMIPGTAMGVKYPEARRRGFPFDTWIDSNNSVYTKDTLITGNITLTSRWKPELDKFTIKFTNSSGVTIDGYPQEKEFYKGEFMGEMMPAPARDNTGIDLVYYTGYLFTGWLGQATGGEAGKLYNRWDIPIEKNDTVVSQWKNTIIPETFVLDLADADRSGPGGTPGVGMSQGPVTSPIIPPNNTPVRVSAPTSYDRSEIYKWVDAEGKEVIYTGVRTVTFTGSDQVYAAPMTLTRALNPIPLKEDGTPWYATFADNRLRQQLTRATTITVEIIGHCTPGDRKFRQCVGNMTAQSSWNATSPTGNDVFEALSRQIGLMEGAGFGTTNAFVIQHREGSVPTPSVVKIASIKISVE